MGLGIGEVIVVAILLLCLFIGPILVLAGFLALLRRIDRLEQQMKELRAQGTPTGPVPPVDPVV
jgi:hypothetical protein